MEPIVDRTWVRDFDSLSRRLRPALTRYFLRRTGSEADAEELVQDLFLRLLRRADLFSLENLEGYVFQAAANLARDKVRRETVRAKGQHDHLGDLDAKADSPSAEDVVDARQRLARLMTTLHGLPGRTRTVLVLRRFEDMSHAQIAERLNISVSAVEKHMARALKALKAIS